MPNKPRMEQLPLFHQNAESVDVNGAVSNPPIYNLRASLSIIFETEHDSFGLMSHIYQNRVVNQACIWIVCMAYI